MYQVLIADDHLDQRELLTFLLNKRPDVWTIYEAKNGKEALEIIQIQEIDLLITDVKMPFATGIELAESLRANNNTVPILFISGYDDFKYAKKALELQAVNYLLKPINPEEFNQQLDKLVARIEKNKREKKQAQHLAKQDVLIKYIKGIPFEKLSPEEQLVAYPVLTNTYYLMTLDVSNDHAPTLEHFLKTHSLAMITFIRANFSRFVGFLHLKSKEEVMRQTRLLKQQIQQDLSIEVTIEISSFIQTIENIYPTYRQLEHAITHTFYQKESDSTYSKNLPTQDSKTENYVLNELQELLKQHDFSLFYQELTTLFQLYESSASESPAIVKFFFANLYRNIIKLFKLDSGKISTGLHAILEATEFPIIIEAFDSLLIQVEQRITTLNESSNEYIRETKNYIWNHYSEDLNLEILANNVHLAPKYLSDLFKREENIGITKYLNEFRMEKAKELLITSHHRVKEISQLVGFNSHSYFIKSFQKYTGMTPDRFRKAKGQIDHEK